MAKIRTNVYTDQDRDTVAGIRGSFRGGRGPGNNVTTPYVPGAGEPVTFIKIMSSARDGSNWRWEYTVRRMKKTTAGFGGWVEADGIDRKAYNTVEDANTDTGVVSGYTLDDGENDTKIVGLEPIADDTIVMARERVIPDGSAVEFHFTLINIPVVEC